MFVLCIFWTLCSEEEREIAVVGRSFFFWMDALGTASMIFEISTLLGSFGKMQTANGSVDAMLMRTARAAKAWQCAMQCFALLPLSRLFPLYEVGARVGRLSKLMKCLSYYLRDKDKNMDMCTARNVTLDNMSLAKAIC